MSSSIPVSTVPRAIAFLFAAVKTQAASDPAPGSIYVCEGAPGIPDPPDIIQVCAGIQRVPSHFALVGDGGPLSTYEKYAIVYKVSSAIHAATEAEGSPLVVARAWTLVAYVETATRTDPSFGGLLVEGWPGQTTGGDPKWSDEVDGTMLCEITGRIQCEAVI